MIRNVTSKPVAVCDETVLGWVPTGPSLSTFGETLTIEESMTLRARTENAGDVGDEHEWSWGR
jgi:hypothetical protein